MKALPNQTWTRHYTTTQVKGKFHAIDVATTEAVLAMDVKTSAIIDRWVIGTEDGGYDVTIIHNTEHNYGNYRGIDGLSYNHDGSLAE